MRGTNPPYDRPLDGGPPVGELAPTDKVAVADIPRRVSIGVRAVRTGPTREEGGLRTISARDVSAPITTLARVPGVYLDNAAALVLRLIG